MTAPAKIPARRLVAKHRTYGHAKAAVDGYWKAALGEDADVRVEHGVPGTTDDRPWGITAARSQPEDRGEHNRRPAVGYHSGTAMGPQPSGYEEPSTGAGP